MMDNPGDDDAGETRAATLRIQPMKPSDQEIATREACGHYPCRDWCRACVGSTGRSDAHKRRHEEQNSLRVASMDSDFFTDGDDGQHTRGATPFLVVKNQAEYDDLEHACLKVWKIRQQSRKRSSR